MRQKQRPMKRIGKKPAVKSFLGLPKAEAPPPINSAAGKNGAGLNVLSPPVKFSAPAFLPSSPWKQCFRCQRWGHLSFTCVLPTRCVKCGEGHRARECKKGPEEKPKCCNCQGQHTSSYRGCSSAPKRKRKRRRCRHPKLSDFILAVCRLIKKGNFLSKEQVALVREEMHQATTPIETDVVPSESPSTPHSADPMEITKETLFTEPSNIKEVVTPEKSCSKEFDLQDYHRKEHGDSIQDLTFLIGQKPTVFSLKDLLENSQLPPDEKKKQLLLLQTAIDLGQDYFLPPTVQPYILPPRAANF